MGRAGNEPLTITGLTTHLLAPGPPEVRRSSWTFRQVFQFTTLFAATCILTGGFIPLGRFMGLVEVLEVGVTDPWANTLQAIVLALMLICVVMNWQRLRSTLVAMIPLSLLWTFCVASTLWSADPATTIRRSLLLLMNFVYGPFSYSVAGTKGTLRVLNNASWFMIAMSLLLYFAFPALGRDIGDYDGALRGIFVQKNQTAWALELALGYLGYTLYATRHVSWRLVMGAIVIIVCIVLARSTTEVLSSGMLCAFWAWSFWYRNARIKAAPIWAGLSVVAVAVSCLTVFSNAIFAALGKDPGLTGRTQIWMFARAAVAEHPFRGWGYQGFWTGKNPAAVQIWNALIWQAPHAHNGILEVLVEVGYLGLGLSVLAAGYMCFYMFLSIRRDSALGWWTLCWMILVVFRAHAEPAYLQIDMDMSLLAFSTVALVAEQRALGLNRRARPRKALHELLAAGRPLSSRA